MRKLRGRRPWFALGTVLIATALSLNACWSFPASLKKPDMTALSPRLEPLFKKTKTVCFGQFVIEVPATAIVVFGSAQVETDIYRYPDEAGKMPEYIAERLKKIEKNKYLVPFSMKEEILGKDSMYGTVIDGSVQGQKQVIGASQGFFQIHSYVPVGRDLFVLQSNSIPTEDNGLQQEIALLNTIASRLRARAQNEVPTEPGSCIDGGFITGPAEFENFTLGVRLAEFPDVHFSIMTIKKGQYLSEGSDLAQRLERAEKDAWLEGNGLWYARIKFFRRAARQLGAWNGFEALARKPAQKGTSESHQFLYYSLGERHAPLVPELDVQLDTGVQGNHSAGKPPSLSDEEAVALWDKLLGSLRPRPAGPKTSGPVTPPLGTLAQAGQPCPTSGWWECSDADGGSDIEVSGGRRQYFRTGERMPQALLLAPPTLWQKLKGERPGFQRSMPSTWKLVDHRDRPRAPQAGPATMPGSTNGTASSSLTSEEDTGEAQRKTPAGELWASGIPCPTSGWWTCCENGALDTSQWFGRGQRLPEVTFRSGRNWLARLKGEPVTVKRPGKWAFVRSEERTWPPASDSEATAEIPAPEDDQHNKDA